MLDPSTPSKHPVHPFRRFFARQFDNILAACVVIFDAQIIWGRGPTAAAIEAHRLTFWIPALFLWCFVEAGLLALKGNTPGKWLFGIRVLPQAGTSPGFWSMLNRSFNALIFGQGGSLPLVSLIAGIQSYRDLAERGTTRWDKDRFTVHGIPFGWRRMLLAGTLTFVLFIVFAVVFLSPIV